ncbi:MAG: N-acetyltransferase family protein [Frankiaceae bacterium]
MEPHSFARDLGGAFDAADVGVGVARCEGGSDGDTADSAVVVDPGWRRVELGSLLLRDLAQAALHRGITRFTALVLAENRPVLALLRASGRTCSGTF